MQSQKIDLNYSEGNLASVTSLVGRIPVFDYHNQNGLCYIRLKKDIVFAKTQKGDSIYVIPTDDLRIKFVVIPLESTLKESILEKVQSSIVNITEDENSDKTELMLPSFTIDVTSQIVCTGMQTNDGKYVKNGVSKV